MTDQELLDKAYEIEGSYRKLSATAGKSPATWQTLHMGKYQHNPEKLYRDWETDRKSTRLNSSHSGESRMPSSA